MTTKREIPLGTDTLTWVHTELTELKSRLNLVQKAAEQSRGLVTDAADTVQQARSRLEQLDARGSIFLRMQDDLSLLREQLNHALEDINSLRQSREEMERRAAAEAERFREEKNEVAKRFADLQRQLDPWPERFAGVEERDHRQMEAIAELSLRIESLAAELPELNTHASRAQANISHLDQEAQRIAAAVAVLESERETQRERTSTALEGLRRLESEVEAVQGVGARLSRIEDRLELIQAERVRHNELLNDFTGQLQSLEARLSEQSERVSLLDARSVGYQDELRSLKEKLQLEREQLRAYLAAVNDGEAEQRKRQMAALEKDIRDIRGRALNIAEE